MYDVQRRIGQEVAATRLEQEKQYNLWALAVLRGVQNDYHAKGKGWFNDDERIFQALLSENWAKIDSRILHPAVAMLYQEIYGTITSELDRTEKINVAGKVERAARLSLEAF